MATPDLIEGGRRQTIDASPPPAGRWFCPPHLVCPSLPVGQWSQLASPPGPLPRKPAATSSAPFAVCDGGRTRKEISTRTFDEHTAPHCARVSSDDGPQLPSSKPRNGKAQEMYEGPVHFSTGRRKCDRSPVRRTSRNGHATQVIQKNKGFVSWAELLLRTEYYNSPIPRVEVTELYLQNAHIMLCRCSSSCK